MSWLYALSLFPLIFLIACEGNELTDESNQAGLWSRGYGRNMWINMDFSTTGNVGTILAPQ
jgi:hypothetical protein